MVELVFVLSMRFLAKEREHQNVHRNGKFVKLLKKTDFSKNMAIVSEGLHNSMLQEKYFSVLYVYEIKGGQLCIRIKFS